MPKCVCYLYQFITLKTTCLYVHLWKYNTDIIFKIICYKYVRFLAARNNNNNHAMKPKCKIGVKYQKNFRKDLNFGKYSYFDLVRWTNNIFWRLNISLHWAFVEKEKLRLSKCIFCTLFAWSARCLFTRFVFLALNEQCEAGAQKV